MSGHPVLPLLVAIVLGAVLGNAPVAVAPAAAPAYDTVAPLLAKYCYECHGNAQATRKADLNLEPLTSEARWQDAEDVLAKALDQVERGVMPTRKATAQPSAAERARLVAWFRAAAAARTNAQRDDPGLVVMPRLTNLEYERVIRDLVGIEIPAARTFAREGGGGEGFSNVGDAQTVDPAHVDQWITAGRLVLSHARITPLRGLRWLDTAQPDLPNAEAVIMSLKGDWTLWHADQEESQTGGHLRVLRKDERVAMGYGAYLEGAWRYEHRAALGHPNDTYEETAAGYDVPLMPSILEHFHKFLTTERINAAKEPGQAELVRLWRNLPAPRPGLDIRALCRALDRRIITTEKKANPEAPADQRPLLWSTLKKRSRSDFSGNFYTSFVPYPGLDLDRLSTPDERKVKGAPAHTHPFVLYAEDMRRNASPSERAELDVLVREMNLAEHPDLAAERTLARNIIFTFASRAWRTELQPSEVEALLQLYEERRPGTTLDQAVKQAMLAVLVSPRFIYRIEESNGSTTPRPLQDRELAERLSFAVWSSIPDQRLLDLAKSGRLKEDDTLRAEFNRLMDDPRSLALAANFAGEWLDFKDFEERGRPDHERFPDFTPLIARDMQEEIIRFVDGIFRNDRGLDELVTARSRELSGRLALYYGVIPEPARPWPERDPRLGAWKRYDLPEGRGGLLTMGAVTVAHSQPRRSSPIKRGAWLLLRLVGRDMPPPPAGVPQLSEDDRDAAGLTVAEQMARHRADPVCMACHQHLDPVGLALENIGPDGRWRTVDGAGAPLVTAGTDAEGNHIDGIIGLVNWLGAEKQRTAVGRQFCRKFLGFALGRSIGLGDEPLIDRMLAEMAAHEWKVRPAMEAAVLSPQFRTRRDQ